MVPKWKKLQKTTAWILVLLKIPTYLERDLRKNSWKLPVGSKTQNQFSRVFRKENQPSLQDQATSPFYLTLCYVKNKAMQVEQGNVSCF